jgi:hypothetical protein
MVATIAYYDGYGNGVVSITTITTNQLLPGVTYSFDLRPEPYREPMLDLPVRFTGGALDWWRYWVGLALLWHSPKRGLAVNS